MAPIPLAARGGPSQKRGPPPQRNTSDACFVIALGRDTVALPALSLRVPRRRVLSFDSLRSLRTMVSKASHRLAASNHAAAFPTSVLGRESSSCYSEKRGKYKHRSGPSCGRGREAPRRVTRRRGN